ncbi:hypothetical protein ACIPMZ_04865 [Scandinavium goeteborgense]|uniref:hypothetical protein n=1 Tax=Scandinavium goeteborgense TaxID=1851514 RepID=UPI003825A4E8
MEILLCILRDLADVGRSCFFIAAIIVTSEIVTGASNAINSFTYPKLIASFSFFETMRK